MGKLERILQHPRCRSKAYREFRHERSSFGASEDPYWSIYTEDSHLPERLRVSELQIICSERPRVDVCGEACTRGDVGRAVICLLTRGKDEIGDA